MTKDGIEREYLKCNTIESIILRIDFLRVIEVKDYVTDILEYLTPMEYRMQEDVLTEVEVSINDPEPLVTNDVIIKKSINKETVYRFIKDKGGTNISISRFFVSCEIRCATSYCFTNYIKVFCELVEKLEKRYKFVDIIRLGLRKINRIVCKEENLFQCVENGIFNNFALLARKNGKELSRIQSQSVDHFVLSDASFNVVRILAEGKLVTEDLTAFQVIIDIDGYLKDQLMSNPIKISELERIICSINKEIFFIYKEHLTLGFLQDLIHKNQEKVVEGVNFNE